MTAIIIMLLLFSIALFFYWERKVRLWLRLPIINLITFIVLFLLGIVEEVYLSCNPSKRTIYIRTSIFQRFFL